MPIIEGSISGSIKTIALDIPSNIKWIGLQNMTGGSVTVNLGIVVSGRDIYFKSVTLAANSSDDTLVDIRVLAGSQVLIVSSGVVHYYLTVE